MREALARIDHDFTLSEPRRKGAKRSGWSGFLSKPRQAAKFAAKYANLIVGLGFAALLIAVLTNALVWQKSRHPAPLFTHSVTIEPKADAKPAEAQAEAPLPAARPAAVSQQPASAQDPAASAPHGRDPMAEVAELQVQKPAAPRDAIAQLLKAPPSPAEPPKSVLAAQKALLKLGYVVKPDGVSGPVFHQALEQFERDHNFPVHGALSPKVMRELASESGLPVD